MSDNHDDQAPPGDRGDRRVKDLIDAGARAELEKWFGLPSFEQLADQGVPPAPPEDPEVVALRKRRADAVAAVDPAFLEAHRRRTEPPPDLLKFTATIEPRGDERTTLIDLAMIDRQHSIAEPRQYE